jgi:quercetin dioxygenase-like cupin family protein
MRHRVAVVIVALLLTVGMAPTVAADEPPLNTTRYMFRTDAAIPTGAFEVAHAVFDFVPGAQSLPHTHPGQAFVTVLESAITFRTGGTEKVYGAGESYVEQPGVVGQVVNTSGKKTTLITTLLLPKGAALSTPVAAPTAVAPVVSTPSAPQTGGGGEAAIIHRLGDG